LYRSRKGSLNGGGVRPPFRRSTQFMLRGRNNAERVGEASEFALG
jgi:hypothetical protein